MRVIGSGRNFGFGFDHGNLDYKIVAVSDVHNKRAVKSRVTRIYSVNSNTWRVAETSLPQDSMLDSYGGVLVRDHLLHWMFWCASTRKRRIGCFDVCGQVWKDDVLLPPYYYEAGRKVSLFEFGVVDGCLFSLFEHKMERYEEEEEEACFFDVWVMEEYGVQDSWFQLLSIPSRNNWSGGIVPIAIISVTDQVLVRQRHSTNLFWFNRKDGAITDAVFDAAPDFSGRQAFVCHRLG